MEEKKSIFGDFVKSLFVIAIAIVLVLAGFAAGKYYTNKKAENNVENNNTIDNKKSVISYESLEKLGTIDKNENNDYFMNIDFVSKNGDVILSYPVINIDSPDVKDINTKIKNSVLEIEKEWLKNKTATLIDPEDKFITLSDGSGYIDLYFYDYAYFRVVESEKYVSIIQTSQDIGHKEDNELKAVYVVDKKTGKELSKEDIAELFNYTNYSKISDKILKDLGYEKYTIELDEENGTSECTREFENIFITKNNKLGIILNEEQISGDYYYRFYEQTSDTKLDTYEF